MKRPGLQFVLVLSLLLNAGVIGALAYRAVQHGGWLSSGSAELNLPDYLGLNAGQRRSWHELEAPFLHQLGADLQEIGVHRETMIREIFSEQPDRRRIEAERAAIAQLQAKQQQRVIEQLLRERAILTREQAQALADLLIRQAPPTMFEERLHGK